MKDYDDWIARLHAFPTYLDQNIALMRRGISHNVLLPRIIVERVAGQVAQLATQSIESSGYIRPFLDFPASVSEADRQRLTREGREAVTKQVQPAFAAFKIVHRSRISAGGVSAGWRVAEPAWRRGVRLARPPVHDDRDDAGRDPRTRTVRGRANPE